MDATHINLHKVIGTTIIATWLNLMLCVLVIDRALYYFRHYHTDGALIKIAVFSALTCDMATIIAECADVYINTVIFQGNVGALQTRLWPRSLLLASTGFSASIVQVFMLHRYWTLTRRRVLTSAVALVILSSLASTLYLTGVLTFFASQNQVLAAQIVPAAVILWLSAAMVADLLIALILVLYYRTTERERTFKSSSILVRRLATLALKTGSFTALTAVLGLVTFVTDMQSNLTVICGFCIGRIYSLTFLYNLNIRRKLINRPSPADVLYIRIPQDLPVENRNSMASNGEDIPIEELRSQRGRAIPASIHYESYL